MQGEKQHSQTSLELAVFGHELRNVLCGVSGLVDLLVASGLRSDQLPLSQAIQHCAQQMQWLMDSIRPQAENFDLQFSPQPVEVRGVEFLEQLVLCHTPSAHSRGNVLLLTVDPELSDRWWIDPHLLRLVLDNLLGNAIKYTHSCGIVLEAKNVVDRDSKRTGLQIRVRDGGAGIDPQVQLQMFKPWTRAEGRDSEDGGTGLGLYVCHCIVSQLKGALEYQFEPAGGSCFTLYLPGALGSTVNAEIAIRSTLLSSVMCVLSLHGRVRTSVTCILARLGVKQIWQAENHHRSDSQPIWVIEITNQDHSNRGGNRHPGLFLKLKYGRSGDTRLVAARWLPAPYLESTLGPVLMELELERKASSEPDEKQGSIRQPR